jgi:hypothetical protein
MPKTKAQTDEHPIIFSGWSIQRILAAEKLQTRRIVKPQPEKIGADVWAYNGVTFYDDETMRSRLFRDLYRGEESSYPYGAADRMWVREAFRFDKAFDDCSPADLVRSKEHPTLGPEDIHYEATPEENVFSKETMGRKRPPIFMPRELCRLRLRVEDIRVECLTDIDAADAYEEGINSDPSFETDNPAAHATKTEMIDWFADKWNDIHGKGAWDENPWVWIVEFSLFENEVTA